MSLTGISSLHSVNGLCVRTSLISNHQLCRKSSQAKVADS
jgi:hypothetical protein